MYYPYLNSIKLYIYLLELQIADIKFYQEINMHSQIKYRLGAVNVHLHKYLFNIVTISLNVYASCITFN